MKSLQNQSGQAVIESIASFTGMICLCLVILGTCFIYVLKICISHWSHEALVCELSRSSTSAVPSCETTLRQQVQRLPFAPSVKSVFWKKTKNHASIEVHLQPLNIFGHRTQGFAVLKKMSLPLVGP